MKSVLLAIYSICLISCQKELSYSKIEAPINSKSGPNNPTVNLNEFTAMLSENYQYQLISYYSQTEDLWSKVPEWVKDDAYTLREGGEGWIDANEDKDPDKPFYGREQRWKIYTDNEEIKLEWVDMNYDPVVYTIASFVSTKSFVVSWEQKKMIVFAEYRIWE